MLIKVLWGTASFLLISCGIYFTFFLRGTPFFFWRAIKKEKGKTTDVQPIETFMMAIAAKVGVGSLAGVALAISIGGLGTIFWIWMSSIFCAANAFVEAYLGTKYQKKEKEGSVGGPPYYIQNQLKNPYLAKVYAILIILTYILGFCTIQANTITTSISTKYSIKPIFIGMILLFIVGVIISKNTKFLFRFLSKFVPIMSGCYLLMGGVALYKNGIDFPVFFQNILTSAFQNKGRGFSIFLIGIQRGIFSNEAGIGTGAIACGASLNASPKQQGYLQVIGTYFISFIITTMTAFLIATSPYQKLSLLNLNGIEITQFAFKYHFGGFGEALLIICILFFAISTILAAFYYGKTNLNFLFPKQEKKYMMVYRILLLLLLVVGSIIQPKFLWNFSDIFIAILAIINIYAIFSLRNHIKL